MSTPVPLVLQIQADALDRSVSTADLLRRARMASSKLGIGSASKWVEHETNGYEGIAPKDLPPYRIIRGQPKFFNPYNGWCPIMTHDEEMADILSTAYLFQPAAVLEKLVKEDKQGNLQLPHGLALNQLITSQIGFDAPSVIMLGRATVWGVVEKVRNLILDWSLELERAGVLGEGMSFTINEKSRAVAVTNNYFAQNIGVAGNVDGGSTVQNNQVAGASLDLESVRNLLQQMQQLTPMLPQGVRGTVEAEARELQAEAAKPQPDQGRMRKLLGSIRSACDGAGGNLVAAGVIEAIKVLLNSPG
ncbi:hypothetical protein MHL39_13430 [Roseomonas mucosa]|uniref:AbiTii domain-containing protein n=1 Tax=Roseomonas mucosa TaxID=207340 RepID=UPI001EF3E6BD|nr:hypothetical protein [Roseomonas mucosa]MCG7357637.1 hypothetical protein [Roseomonas mucosa]